MTNKKQIIIVKCDDCGKENRIKKSNLWDSDIRDLNDNYGCYCSKCMQSHKNEHKLAKCILVSEFFTLFPKIIDVEHIKGVRKAKDIFARGIKQMNNKDN